MSNTTMEDLVEFLFERLDEEEKSAQSATQGKWKVWAMEVVADPKGNSDIEEAVSVCVASSTNPLHPRTGNAEHIAMWDPERVLAECKAKREMIQEWDDWKIYFRRNQVSNYHYGIRIGIESALIMLVQVYSNHPDFQEEWKYL